MIINLSISFSEQSELDRVEETIKRLSWYREHNYPDSFAKLPQGVTDKMSTDTIAQTISAEYNVQEFEEVEKNIRVQWSIVVIGFNEMEKIPLLKIRNTYSVVLTKYGSGGSYDSASGTLIIRIGSAKRNEEIIGIIVHEIVHMTIQYLIDTYHVSHWRKERFVDLLVEQYFPGLKKMQYIKEDVSTVDKAFSKSFPNIEAITKSIGTGIELSSERK